MDQTNHEWICLRSRPHDAAENMAVDEALLRLASRLPSPVLRFYSWNERAATFGYFQRYERVAEMTSLRPLVRRPTGGGLVNHDGDWTYSVTIPSQHEWHGISARESYARMHEWIRKSLQRLNLRTSLADQPPEGSPAGQCFLRAERADLVRGGKKVAGAAQRRTFKGLLIQGSIQPGERWPDHLQWQDSMMKQAIEEWGVVWVEFDSWVGHKALAIEMEALLRSGPNGKRVLGAPRKDDGSA